VIGQFDDTLILPANGGVIDVKGPLKVDDNPEIDGDITGAVIHFLIIQGEGNNTVTAIGQGHWSRPDDKWTAQLPADAGEHPDKSPGMFSTDVQDGRARGIGLAIAIKAGKVKDGAFIPPSFQALTWCADFKFVRDQAAAA
jgi:hypothetical protein